MSRLTIGDRASLVLLGWQSECAKQVGASHLVHSYTPPEAMANLPDTLESCVDLGREELRRHLAAVRGDADRTPLTPTTKCRGCGTVLNPPLEGAEDEGLCGLCLVKDEREALARGERLLGMLRELREGWRVTLRSDERGWTLEVVPKSPYRFAVGHAALQHRYVGTDLPKLVARAWAGEPGDQE